MRGPKPGPETVLKRETEAAQFRLMERSAPEILDSVLNQARVAAANIKKSGGGSIGDGEKLPASQVWKQLSSHQKIKAFLDYGVSLMVQPEIARRFLDDLLEDSKGGKLARMALTRSLIMQTPKEINIDVNSKTGVMLVPTKAESLTAWMEETGLAPKAVEGEVVSKAVED